jgi:oxygen-independent coproporphyrinogen-3 oxidase
MDLPTYYASIEKGKLPVWKGITLDSNEAMDRYIIFKLKYDQKVENSVFQQKFGKNLHDVYQSTLSKLHQLGLIENNKNGFQLTYAGMLFCEEVCVQFYTSRVKNDLQKLKAVYSGYMFKSSKYQ